MDKPALCRLSQFQVCRISGPEARIFLNNLLTCDVNALKPGSSVYGGLCTPKGRLLATFLLWCAEHGFFMQLPAALSESVRGRLSKYILRSKVIVADASEEFMLFGVSGGAAFAVLQRIFGTVPLSLHEGSTLQEATIIKLPGERYEIAVAAEKVSAFRSSLNGEITEFPPQLWEWTDIRAGIPTILPETQEEFIPQMVNLDLIGGVSFTKGCYPGQEIVARMHYLGRLKQRMYLGHIDSEAAPCPGDRLYSAALGEQACGMIVNAAPAPGGGHDVLASVQISSAAAGDVRWKDLNGRVLGLLPQPYDV
jgi:folate-binding protein YgfZ